MIKAEFKGDGHKKLKRAIKAVQGERGQKALAMALNETGKVARNKVERAVGKQMGVSGKIAGKRGEIGTKPAFAGRLEYKIAAKGGFLSLKDYGAVQNKAGVVSKPWGPRRTFGGAFMGPRPGAVSIWSKGHAFHRTGEFAVASKGQYQGQVRERIAFMYGPALPKEIVKDQSKAVFETYTNERLPKRVAHHLARLSKGALS